MEEARTRAAVIWGLLEASTPLTSQQKQQFVADLATLGDATGEYYYNLEFGLNG